jgi:hypothetical protein
MVYMQTVLSSFVIKRVLPSLISFILSSDVPFFFLFF